MEFGCFSVWFSLQMALPLSNNFFHALALPSFQKHKFSESPWVRGSWSVFIHHHKTQQTLSRLGVKPTQGSREVCHAP